jgi:hypothetical protein
MHPVNTLFLTRLQYLQEHRKVGLSSVNKLCCQFVMIYNTYEYHFLEILLL